MVMDPNGHWRRESANGFNRNYLAGFRFLQMSEILDWTAEDIVVNGAQRPVLDQHRQRPVWIPDG